MKNKEILLIITAFLTVNHGLLSANMASLVTNGKVRITDSELYIRSAVTASGTQNLLAGLTIKTVGITNFDGQRLEADRYFVVSDVTINYGVATTGTSAAAVNYTTALPAALKNSNLIIKQDGQVIFALPISAINDAKSSDTRYRELLSLYLLRDQYTIEALIEFPAGADLAPGAGNTGYVELLLKGAETISKR